MSSCLLQTAKPPTTSHARCAHSVSLNHNGASDQLQLVNGTSAALFTLNRADGSSRLNGDLTIGANHGPRAVTISSTSADAGLAVVSASSASIVATSSATVKARVLLTENSNSFALQTSGSNLPNFVVNDGSSDLVVVQPTTGTTTTTGDLSLSGPGQKTLFVPSDHASLLSVVASGASDATFNVTAASGKVLLEQIDR